MLEITLKDNSIILSNDFFQSIKSEMLHSRNSFDYCIYKYMTEDTKNKRYIEIPNVLKHERHRFHLFARPSLYIYSIGEEINNARTIILQFKRKYINDIIKKYENEHIDISKEIENFKKIVISGIETQIENLIFNLKIK
jgi:hypothetical protein